MKNQPIRMRARSARSKGNYQQALEICEEAFVSNPWDVATSREAAEAAEELGNNRLAQWLIESVQNQANDPDFFRYAASVHERNEDWQKAIACWEQVKKMVPNDENAGRQINALSASATIKRARYNESLEERAQAGKGVETSSSMAESLESLRTEPVSPEKQWAHAIKTDPTQPGPYLHLADSYSRKGRLDEAERLLAQGLKAIPNDPALTTAYAETQLARLRRAIEKWSQRVKEKPHDLEAKAKLDQATKLLLDYEVRELKRRSSLHPLDANLHYQLGLALARDGRHDEAIAEFQQARSNPELRIQALIQAGLSFEANGAFKLAERAYRDALKSTEAEDTASFNMLHYRLGRVSEAMGNLQSAEEHYNEVAANDYTYEDVAARLRNLN
jgi:tetratricopeptide (TPR) repeat protein